MPIPVKFITAILLAPILIALIARFSDPVDQLMRGNLGTHAGRLMVTYSTILFCFMAGALWGFAARNTKNEITPYILTLIPAFFMLSAFSVSGGYRVYILTVGFSFLLVLDIYFKKRSLTPHWWLRFKTPLTAVVVFSLVTYQFGNLILATLALT
jgi:hypothetical protein